MDVFRSSTSSLSRVADSVSLSLSRLPASQRAALVAAAAGAGAAVVLWGAWMAAGSPSLDSLFGSGDRRRARSGGALSKHELALMSDFVGADDVSTTLDDLGGLESQIKEVEELVIFPLSHPHLYQHSSIAQRPTGVLLYGPPGTGKTMLARALARTANANFLSLNVASMQSKWFGETPKMIDALFSLAHRHAPCVIFVDEIDGVLSERSNSDGTHVNTMKTKFMECWDGLTSAGTGASGGGSDWVIVIGATNKPWALDPAILRRMPRQIFLGLPDAPARRDILGKLLRRERVEPSADTRYISEITEGYSGSDLKEVVRAAALTPIREAYARERELQAAAGAAAPPARGGPRPPPAAPTACRPIKTADLMEGVRAIKPTGAAARDYLAFQRATSNAFSKDSGGGGGGGGSARTPPSAPRNGGADLARAVEALAKEVGAVVGGGTGAAPLKR